jgi:hypothetical protein
VTVVDGVVAAVQIVRALRDTYSHAAGGEPDHLDKDLVADLEAPNDDDVDVFAPGLVAVVAR